MRLTQMATIATPLLQRKKEPDEEQLLKLFWNRAELKKELGKLRREKEKLIEQIRQQDGVNLRAQQRLDQMENLLAEPLQAANASVYYQLRGVWQHCRKRLQNLARELTERQQDREEQYALSIFEQQRDGRLAEIDEKIAQFEERVRVAKSDLHLVDERVRKLRGFWNYFQRRAARDQGAAISATLEGINAQVDRLQAERREVELESAPVLGALSIEGRRNINLAVIAMAQQLLVHFAAHNVAGLAREASVRGLADVGYGAIEECRMLSQNIEAVLKALELPEKLAVTIRQRAEFLRANAQYRRETDTVPVAGSFSVVPLAIPGSEAKSSGGNKDRRIIPVNVLADEYWDIYSVLLS